MDPAVIYKISAGVTAFLDLIPLRGGGAAYTAGITGRDFASGRIMTSKPCWTKKAPHWSREAAETEAARMASLYGGQKKWNAYQCKKCGQWHIGRSSRADTSPKQQEESP